MSEATATRIRLSGPWLEVILPEQHHVLSWAVLGGGWTTTRKVAWRQVRNADLPPEVDPARFLRDEIVKDRLFASEPTDDRVVALLTSASIGDFAEVIRRDGNDWVRCVATVGLSNALRVGDAVKAAAPVGTINLLVQTSRSLGHPASLEALSIAVEARTLAVLEAVVPSIVSGAPATGTGTDCVAIASPARPRHGAVAEVYAGKHTPIGSLVGQASRAAVAEGIERWKARRSVRWEAVSLG